ncbi:YadA-like family protein [Gallibacterium anatis]|uniref:YadA-like family protein n=1 Tax=Gallibacterium anatis TaxID=750 RepID=UPI0039FC40D7
MNKIYKVIFNRNKNRYEIVSELASSRGGKCKVKAGKQIAKLFMTGLLATSLSSVASAADEEVKVKYDAATGTIKIVKAGESQVLASYAVGGNISPITSIGDKDSTDTKNPTGIIAMGDQSKAVQSNTIAIGADAHAGDVGGSDDTNGRIAIGTKTVASGNRSIALGNQSTTNDGSYNIAQGNDSIGIGTSTSVFGYSGVSIGRRNIIGIPDPTLVSKDGVLTTKSRTKYSEDDLGGNSVIVGAYNVAYGNRSNVIGTYSRAMGSNSVAIGSGVQSLSDGSIAIGKGSGYEFEEGSRKVGRREKEFYGRDWELPPEYKVLKQVLSTDIAGDKQYKKTGSTWENGGTLPKYNNYGAGSSDPGGFIVEGKNALGIGTYTQVRGDSAIGLATGEMTADLSKKDKSQYARDMRKIMDMEETLYEAKEALKAGTGDTATLESNVKAAEKSLATAKKDFRDTYLKKYSFVDGDGALGVGRQILAQGNRSMAVGDYAKAISSDAIAYGGQTLANGTNSMAMGGSAHVGTETDAFANSMAIGSHTNVQAGNAVALGAFSQVTGTNSLALGFGTQSSTDSNNITYNSVSGHDSTLIGSYGNIAGNNSILIGSSGSIANDRVVGLGNNINIEAADSNDQENNTAGSVFLGDHAGYVKDSKRARSLGKVTLVGSKEEKELTESLSSTKGALRDYTEDFIYIYMLERQDDGTQIGAPIAVRSDFAGGDSTVGVVSVGSTYEQTFENLDKIKEHHKKVGSLITVPVEVTVQVTKNGISLGEQQQIRYFAADAKEEDIKNDSTLSDEDKKKVWDTIQESRKKADTKYTVFETRRIQNVAPGLIGSNSTDAINGSQLFATNQMLGNLVGSLKKTFGDNVTITEDGQINVSGGGTLGWIAKAKAADGGTVDYQVGKDDKITKDNLKEKGSAIEAADQLVFQAGKNIGLVQTPDTLTISTIDTPSFKSVELRGETKEVNGSQETPVTMVDSSGMQVYTETVTPGDAGPTTTKKVSTTVNNKGVTTDGTVKVTNGKDGDQAKEFVTIDKGTDGPGTDKEYGKIGLDGKNGSKATLTVDRGTKSVTDSANVGKDPTKPIDEDNPVAGMDRLTYTTTGPNNETINHEVATLDDGFMLTTSTDVANSKAPANVKLNHTIKFTDGANTKVSTVTSKDGVHELHVDVTGLPVTYTASVVDDQGNPTNTQNVSKVGDTYQLEDGTKLVKSGDKYYKLDQIENGVPKAGEKGLTIDNSIRVINPEDPSKTAKITNVAPGEADTDAVNMSQLKQKAAAATTEVTGTGAAEVTKVTGANGQNIYNVHVDKLMTVKAVDSATQVARGSDGKYYNADDIAGKTFVPSENKWYNTADVDATTGKPLEGKSALANQPLALDQSKLKNSVVNPNGDGATIVDNVKSGIGGEAGNGIQNGTTIDGTTGNNTFIKNLDKVGKPASEGGIDKTTVVNAGDLKNLADTPLFFSGDSADGVAAADGTDKNTFARKLSQETKIVGGVDLGLQADATAEQRKAAIADKLTDGNIGVISDGTDTLTVKLAKNLVNLTSVETGSGDNKTKMTENGVTTTVKDGDTFKVTTTTPNGLATTEVKLDSNKMPTGESKTTTVTTDGVTITTQTPKNGGKPASTTETKLSKDGLATDGTVKVTNGKTGDDAKDLVTIGKGTETDPNATDKEFGTVAIDGKNGSNATLTVDRGTKSVTDKANILKDPKQPAEDNNPVSMDRLTYTTTGADGKSIIKHEVATLDDGFFLTTEHTEEDKTRTVLFNHTIKVLDGANTKVSAMGGEDGTHTFSIDVTGLPMTYTATDANGKTQDVHKVGDTYTLADGTKLVQVGDKFYKPDQVEEVNGTPQVKAAQEDKDTKLNNISLTSPVANTAPTLSNVGSALKKSDGTRITMSNLDDSSVYPTNNPIWNNAVNVGDLKAATDAARTEVTGTGKAIVTKKTGDKGQNIYNVHVDPIVDVVGADGSKVVRGDDGKYYNPTDIANKTFVPDGKGGGSWYNNSDLTDGKPKPDAKPQTIETANIKNKMVNPNGGDSIVLDNIKSGIGGEVKDSTHNNENTFIDNINKVGKKSDDGTEAPDAISENTVVNAGDLKNLVDTGFKLNTSGHSGDAQTVKIGDTIKVVDGANTRVSDITPKDGVHEFHIDVTGLPMTYTVSQTGGTDAPVSVSKVGDTYQLADGTKLVKVGNKFYKPSQLVNPKAEQPQVKPEEENKDWTVNDSISLVNKDGSNNAPTLKNVGSGLKDAAGNATSIDQAVGTNAVNVDDLRTIGKAATTEVTGTGAAEVTKVTGANGQNIYNVHVERFMQVAETDVEGNKVVKAADNYYYKEADIKDKTYIDGQWYNNTDIEDKTKIGDKWYSNTEITDGKANPGATELTVKATTPNKAVGLQNNLVNPNDNTPTRLSNLASALSGEVGNGANPADNSAINGIDKNGKPTSESGNNTFVKNVLDLDATEKTVEQLKTSLGHEPSEDEVKAEKARAEKDKALLNSAVTVADLQKTLQSPLFFEGDSADGVANENDSDKNTFARKLSQKTKIVGGVDLGLKENATAEDRKKAIADKLTDGNIGVISDGSNTLTVKLAKNLVNLTSVETGSGDNKTKMTKNGITTTVKDGDTFKVTTTTPNGLATTEVKLDSEGMPKGESTTTMVTTDGVTITTQTPKNGDKPASTTETKLSKDGLATDGTIKVTGDNAKDLVTIGKGTDGSGTDKEYGKIGLDGKNGSNATITVDRGTSSLDDTKNIGGTDPKQDISENNPAKMDRITYTTKNKEGNDVTHEVATLDDGFMLTTSTDIANSKAPANVKLNNTIKFTDGANTKVSTVTSKDGVHELHVDVTGLPMTYTVSQTGGTDAPVSVSKVGDTYQLANGTKLVKVDDKFYKPDQLDTNGQPNADQADKDWKVTNSISLVNPNGEKNAPTLKHVGSGLVDDAGNVTSLADAPDTNAVNVGDLKQVAAAAKTEVTGSGAAEVTKVTGADGQNIYNVHVDKLMTVKPVDPKANITRGGDGKYYNADNIAGKTFVSDGNGGGSWYNASDVDAKTGKPLKDKSPLAEQPIALDQSKLKNSVVNPNGDGATIVDNVKSGIGGEVKDTSGKNTFIKKLEKVGGTGEGAIDKTTVVNAGDLKNLADTPLFFQGDVSSATGTNNTFSRKLSEKVSIVGEVKDGLADTASAEDKANTIRAKLSDGNIGVVSNGTDTLTIKLAKELQNLTSVTTGSGDNTTVMNQDGVTITTQTPKNGDKPASTTETKLSKDGLATDGTVKVTNGKTGDDAKDLVTIGKGTETDQNATDKEFGTVTIDGKNGSNATLTVDRGTSSLDDTKNIGTDPNQDISENNPAKMDRITYTTKNKDGKDVTHEVATLDDGFFLTTSTDVAKGKAAAGVKLNHTIKFTDGANTKVSTVDSKDGIHELHVDVTGLPMTYTVSQTGGTDAPVSVSKVGDTYQLADGTKLVKVGNKFYKPSQLVDPDADKPQVKPEEVAKNWTVNDSISLVNKDGSNNAPTTLKNVGSGLKDANGNDTTLDKAVGSNAVNVDDLRTMGKAATTEVTGTGAAEVTKVTGANGQNIYNVHVDKLMTVKPVDPKANITRGGDGKYYNADNIAGKTFVSDGNGGGSWYNASDVDAKTGKPLKDKSPLAEQPIALDQSKLKNSVVNPNGDGATIVDNVKSGIGGEVKDTSGKNTFIKKLEKVGGTGEGAIDKTTVVNAGDLKNLADTPLFFQGDVSSATGTNNTFSRKLSEKVSIVGEVKDGLADTASAEDKANTIRAKLSDGNIGVVSNGTDTLTIKLAKDLTDLHSVTTTDDKGNTTQINGKGLATTADNGKGNIKITTVTSDGITIVTTDKDGNNSVSLTNKGLDNGHHQIINVKSGLLDRQGNPVTLKNAPEDILNNAVNVKDLRDVVQGLTDSGKGGGFGLTGNNGEVRKSLGETITLKGGIANKIENGIDMNKPEKATTDKNTYIDVKTSKNGSEKIMVVEIAKDLTDLNSAEFTDQEGNTTKMKGDGIYIDKNGDGNADISLTSEGLNNGGNKITNVADGTEDTDAVNVSQLNKLKQEIKQNIGDEINELNAYAPVVYSDKEGNRVIRKGNKFVKKNDETVEILPQDIRLSLVNADGKTTNPSTLQNVAKGVNKTDAVNVEQLKDATEKPLTFNGDAGSSSAKLGETVAIKGGANSADLTDNNIGVIADSTTKTLNVKLSKKLKGLESAEFVDNNGNTTNITGDGVHISGGNGSNVSLTSQGLNNGGNRITNVAPGVEATDAVNVSQLNQVGAALHNRINNVAKGAYGGVASAGAMASLPQAYLPGKSMVAAGASHYRGESAVALGASRISDNGKIILKLNASHNTSGNTMVGAGVGYQF